MVTTAAVVTPVAGGSGGPDRASGSEQNLLVLIAIVCIGGVSIYSVAACYCCCSSRRNAASTDEKAKAQQLDDRSVDIEKQSMLDQPGSPDKFDDQAAPADADVGVDGGENDASISDNGPGIRATTPPRENVPRQGASTNSRSGTPPRPLRTGKTATTEDTAAAVQLVMPPPLPRAQTPPRKQLQSPPQAADADEKKALRRQAAGERLTRAQGKPSLRL